MNMKVVMECMYQSMQWRWLRLAPQCFAFTSNILRDSGAYVAAHKYLVYSIVKWITQSSQAERR